MHKLVLDGQLSEDLSDDEAGSKKYVNIRELMEQGRYQEILEHLYEVGYMPASAILGLIEIPVLFMVQYLVLVTKQSTAYETAYAITLSQLIAILIFFKCEGLYVFDVPKQARVLLLVRGVLHCMALIVLMKTLEFFNPLVALVNFQVGLFTAVIIGRCIFRGGREFYISLVPCIKFSVTAIIMIQGWTVYETMPLHYEEMQAQYKENWWYYYQGYVALGMLGGALLAGASRLSNSLCKPEMLNHEAYMALYAYSICAFILPLLMYSQNRTQDLPKNHTNKSGPDDNCHPNQNCEPQPQDTQPPVEKALIFFSMFILIAIKTLLLDRIIMKRFVDEYDEKRHTLPYSIGKLMGQEPPPESTISEQEQEDESNQLAFQQSWFEGRKVNLSIISTMVMFLMYWLSYEAGESLEVEGRPGLNLWIAPGCAFACFKMGVLLTYYDDVEVFV